MNSKHNKILIASVKREKSIPINYIKFRVLSVFIRSYYYNKLIDKVWKDVLENPVVHEKWSGQLVKVVRIPRIKQLMTNLFVRMLYDDGFDRNTYRLTHKIIIDYLDTKHWEDKFTELIINKVLENPEVRQNMFNLLQDYVLNKDAANLKIRAEYVLQSVLKMDGIRRYINNFNNYF